MKKIHERMLADDKCTKETEGRNMSEFGFKCLSIRNGVYRNESDAFRLPIFSKFPLSSVRPVTVGLSLHPSGFESDLVC